MSDRLPTATKARDDDFIPVYAVVWIFFCAVSISPRETVVCPATCARAGVPVESIELDSDLAGRRSDLVHTAALLLEKNGLVKYDRRGGSLQVRQRDGEREPMQTKDGGVAPRRYKSSPPIDADINLAGMVRPGLWDGRLVAVGPRYTDGFHAWLSRIA